MTGPEGNAFFILGTAQRLGKQLKMSETKINEIIEDMQSSGYEHLIQVFDNHFGDYIDIVR